MGLPVAGVVLVVGILAAVGSTLQSKRPTPTSRACAPAVIEPTNEVPTYSPATALDYLDVDARVTNIDLMSKPAGGLCDLQITASIATNRMRRLKVAVFAVDATGRIVPHLSASSPNVAVRGTACWITAWSGDGPKPEIVDVPLTMRLAASRFNRTPVQAQFVHVVLFDSSDRILAKRVHELPPPD